jgi:hypothetical protein
MYDRSTNSHFKWTKKWGADHMPKIPGLPAELSNIRDEPEIGDIHGSPGTVSKILWHFTGGPTWDAKRGWQGAERKSDEASYAALLGILQSRTLRVSQYSEIIRIFEASDPTEDSVCNQTSLTTKPVCCVADIPIIHLSYHANRYGKIAIGFHRESLIAGEFSPVFYQPRDSFLLKRIRDVALAVNANSLKAVADILSKMIHEDTADTATTERQQEYARWINILNELSTQAERGFSEVLPYIKTFFKSEFSTVYCEREWRATKDFSFAYKDIAMIVVPRIAGDIANYDRFLEEDSLAEAINPPRSVPIVPWEDLVEH